jgi:hypothetical protein
MPVHLRLSFTPNRRRAQDPTCGAVAAKTWFFYTLSFLVFFPTRHDNWSA